MRRLELTRSGGDGTGLGKYSRTREGGKNVGGGRRGKRYRGITAREGRKGKSFGKI